MFFTMCRLFFWTREMVWKVMEETSRKHDSKTSPQHGCKTKGLARRIAEVWTVGTCHCNLYDVPELQESRLVWSPGCLFDPCNGRLNDLGLLHLNFVFGWLDHLVDCAPG